MPISQDLFQKASKADSTGMDERVLNFIARASRGYVAPPEPFTVESQLSPDTDIFGGVPTATPPASTNVILQPGGTTARFQESGLGRLAHGVVEGMTGLDVETGLAGEGVERTVGRVAGSLAPFGLALRGLSLLARGSKVSRGVFNLGRGAAGFRGALQRGLGRAVRGAALGTAVGGLEQIPRAIVGQETAPERIAEDAALFAGFDVVIPGLGGSIKKLWRARQYGRAEKLYNLARNQVAEGERLTLDEAFKKLRDVSEVPFISVGKNELVFVGNKRMSIRRLQTSSPAVNSLQRYWSEISVPTEERIATRATRGGKLVPAVRQSGVFVPETFAKYGNFKDIAGVQSKTPTYAIQEIDGALSVDVKAGLAGQAGPTEQNVLWRTRDMTKMKIQYSDEKTLRLANMLSGAGNPGRKSEETATRVWALIDEGDATKTIESLLARPDIRALTNDPKIVRLAQESRKIVDDMLNEQNVARVARNQETIPRANRYTPDWLRDKTIWERAFGSKETPRDIMRKPAPPDYIKPNKPFNRHELAKTGDLKDFEKEMRISRLLEEYINTSGKDIFNTAIIQNNKAFAQQLHSLGFPNSARYIENWTAEGYAGLMGFIDRGVALNSMHGLRGAMRWFRKSLNRTVFPLNLRWNLGIQTSSALFTVTRAGVINSTKALDWFFSPKLRKDIADNAYSFIVKTQRFGRMAQQDINRGITRAKIRSSKLDSAVDAANFFTEFVERHLTGWSVSAGLKEGAKRGLRGKALWEFASDMGGKTQSMYNYEDLNGILRNELVKTPAPFQTFKFELYNMMKEWWGVTGTPPKHRMAWLLRFVGGATALNYMGNAIFGRAPWEVGSFIPFYSLIFGIPEAALLDASLSKTTVQRGLPAPVGIATEFTAAGRDYIKNGRKDKLRRWGTKYLPGMVGIPGGTQINRIVDGIITISDGGVRDASGRMMFPVSDTKDQIQTFLSGRFATEEGKKWLEERDKSIIDLFIEEPARKRNRGRIRIRRER